MSIDTVMRFTFQISESRRNHGLEEDEVEKIIRRYVSRTAAIEAVIRQIDAARPGTDSVKPGVKPSKK